MSNIRTIKFRIKDSGKSAILSKMSSDVNFVWNYCNDVTRRRWKESRKYTSKFDLQKMIKGSSKELSINAQTIQAVAYEVVLRIQKAKKQIRFRSRKKSLPWIPFQGQTIKFVDDKILYNGSVFPSWKSRELPGKIKMGSFTCDTRGRWYVNFVCADTSELFCGQGEVGIDPGLITTATTSSGEKLKAKSFNRWEKKLAMAQRAKKKKLTKTIHAKIKNSRKDLIEKFTTKIARENSLVVVGNLSPKAMIKTRFAKSAYDNGIATLKTRLSHKVKVHGGKYLVVPENYTSRTCSHCGVGWLFPKGLKSLHIREYECPGCGVVADRDVNAARNILHIGRDALATNGLGILTAKAAERTS